MAAVHQPSSVQAIRAHEALWDAAVGFVDRARQAVPAIGIPPDQQALMDVFIAAVMTRDRAVINGLISKLGPPPPAQGPDAYAGQLGAIRAFHDTEAGDRSVVDRLPPGPARERSRNTNWRATYLRGLMFLRAGKGAVAVTSSSASSIVPNCLQPFPSTRWRTFSRRVRMSRAVTRRKPPGRTISSLPPGRTPMRTSPSCSRPKRSTQSFGSNSNYLTTGHPSDIQP